MTAKLRLSLPQIIPDRLVHLFGLFPLLDSKERALKLALCLSFTLHIIVLIPIPRFKLSPDFANLMEVSLVAPKSRQEHQSKLPPPFKPNFKQKLKTKIKNKPAALKKQKTITKKSPLAKRRSIPKKNQARTSNKLAEIKKKLALEREEQKLLDEKRKLDDIRQRHQRELSSTAMIRQARLIMAYQTQLKAWLMRNWHLPEHLLNSGLEATISLTIDASGKLLEQFEEKLSNNLIFDNAMRQAIINANPFPSFPADLNIPREEFVITFNPNNISQ
ncbi:MAG: TonB C-terminal domain-containing protein [Deltaproteobacteria bacterium]|nr:TonB C-terminal domain-containing protein [Deltaproteobacteria bacterium]